MKQMENEGWLVRLSAKAIRYFLLSLFGFGVACLLSGILGMGALAHLILKVLEQWIWRAVIMIACLVATTAVAESIR
ncbi:MAG: hypothetical protein F6K19_08680 [Cyanothece sp. SIO1E1]|nr:hypothetical protein [Cyanothece sp. SIO1E1]